MMNLSSMRVTAQECEGLSESDIMRLVAYDAIISAPLPHHLQEWLRGRELRTQEKDFLIEMRDQRRQSNVVVNRQIRYDDQAPVRWFDKEKQVSTSIVLSVLYTLSVKGLNVMAFDDCNLDSLIVLPPECVVTAQVGQARITFHGCDFHYQTMRPMQGIVYDPQGTVKSFFNKVYSLAWSCATFEQFEKQAQLRGLLFTSPHGWIDMAAFQHSFDGEDACWPCVQAQQLSHNVQLGDIQLEELEELEAYLQMDGMDVTYHAIAVDTEDLRYESNIGLLNLIHDGACVCAGAGLYSSTNMCTWSLDEEIVDEVVDDFAVSVMEDFDHELEDAEFIPEACVLDILSFGDDTKYRLRTQREVKVETEGENGEVRQESFVAGRIEKLAEVWGGDDSEDDVNNMLLGRPHQCTGHECSLCMIDAVAQVELQMKMLRDFVPGKSFGVDSFLYFLWSWRSHYGKIYRQPSELFTLAGYVFSKSGQIRYNNQKRLWMEETLHVPVPAEDLQNYEINFLIDDTYFSPLSREEVKRGSWTILFVSCYYKEGVSWKYCYKEKQLKAVLPGQLSRDNYDTVLWTLDRGWFAGSQKRYKQGIKINNDVEMFPTPMPMSEKREACKQCGEIKEICMCDQGEYQLQSYIESLRVIDDRNYVEISDATTFDTITSFSFTPDPEWCEECRRYSCICMQLGVPVCDLCEQLEEECCCGTEEEE